MGFREQQASSLHVLAHRASGEGKKKFASWIPFCTRQWWCNWKAQAKAHLGDRWGQKIPGLHSNAAVPPTHNFQESRCSH